jgi:ribonuclease-3
MANSANLERNLGIQFTDKSLLQRALTHRSYLNEHPGFPFEDNERLEFLGDAVLDFVTGEYLYHRYPELREGQLTSLRSVLVRRETLARFALQFDLGHYLMMGRGEAETGGRERPAILCASFEALVGALYLDQGLDRVRTFVGPFIEPVVARTLREESDKDAKSRLQELVQGRLRRTPRYLTIDETGPDHAKVFTIQVLVNGEVYGQGSGLSKQQAAQSAAQDALERLASGRLGAPEPDEEQPAAPEGA